MTVKTTYIGWILQQSRYNCNWWVFQFNEQQCSMHFVIICVQIHMSLLFSAQYLYQHHNAPNHSPNRSPFVTRTVFHLWTLLLDYELHYSCAKIISGLKKNNWKRTVVKVSLIISLQTDPLKKGVICTDDSRCNLWNAFPHPIPHPPPKKICSCTSVSQVMMFN